MAIPLCHIPAGFSRARPGGVVEPMLKQGVWMLAVIPALVAGWTDWRWRRIPNWLTVPALLLGIAANCACHGLGRSERIAAGSRAGTGAVAALRPDKKPGRWGLEAGRRAGRVFRTVAADYRVTGDGLCGGIDGGSPDHLEETGGPDVAQSWTHRWRPCLPCTCPDRRFRWIIRNLRRYRLEWRWRWRWFFILSGQAWGSV